MQKAVAKGRQSVIIIDELQALESTYFNDQRELLKELFNFFVAMTKESHLCHIIIAGSNGGFIERIYKDSKLDKTSKFLEVDYLNREDILLWLGDLEQQSNITTFSLTAPQKEATWQTFGGSCREISAFSGDLLQEAEDGAIADERFNNVIQKKQIAARSLFEEYAELNNQKTQLLNSINTIHNNKGRLNLIDLMDLIQGELFTEIQLRAELSELIRQNFLAYNPVITEYKIQGKCLEIGLNMFVKMG